MKMLYQGLVALHPPAFRHQFGAEMELIFDESGRPLGLLADVAVSLVRQWILRTRLWIFALAALGGVIPFALSFGVVSFAGGSLGVGPVPHRHLPRVAAHAVSPPATEPFIMLATVIAVMFISGTTIFAITWFRYSQKCSKHAR
jgi:hypothetical protein